MAPKTVPGVPLGSAMNQGPAPQQAHPFAQYPYAPRPQVPPQYVGPAWAAPAPHPPQRVAGYAAPYPQYPQAQPNVGAPSPYVPAYAPPPAPPRRGAARAPAYAAQNPMLYAPPQKKTGGCLMSLLWGFATLGIVVGGAAAAITYGGAQLKDLQLPSIAIPTATVTAAHVPLPTSPIAPVAAPVMTSTYKGGTCTGSNAERTDDDYRVTRKSGSAVELRGRVAALHIILGGGSAAWPRPLTTKIEEAALLSQRFYLDQAARYGVTDLTFDVITWPLVNSPVDLPKLTVDGRKRLDDNVEKNLHDDAQKAIEQSIGTSLESVVVAYRQKGYASVAFFIHLSVSTDARDFAMRATSKHPSVKPEIAILFPNVDPLGDLAVIVAHEGFHLFGADDLYRQKVADKGDAHDVMSDYCTGFKQATAADVTAYAVGWRATPPPRGFHYDEE